MRNNLLIVIASAGLIAGASVPALADTSLTAKGVKVVDQWIVGQTNRKLAEAPGNILEGYRERFGTIDNQEALDKLWKAWRTGDAPKVDFAKNLVLVLTHWENAEVLFDITLDDNGALAIAVESTQREVKGMTYVLAVVERAGMKALGKVPFKPAP
jgi:hypothetical protein